MMKTLVIAAATLLACSGSFAQSKKELVAKVLQLTQPGVEQLARSVAEQPAAALLQRAAPALQRVPADKRETVAKQMQADAKAYVDDANTVLRERAVKLLPETLGAALDAKFSEDELKALIAWHESPVNRKFQEVTPQVNRELLQRLVNDTRPALEPKLKELGATMAKRLGLPQQQLGAPTPAASATK